MSYQAKNTFSKAIVDTNTAYEYISSDMVTRLENFDLLGQGDNLVVRPSKGNTQRGSVTAGKAKTFLGATVWANKIYLFYTRDLAGSFIREYDTLSATFDTIIDSSTNIPGFPLYTDPDLDTYVLSANVVDGVYLYWTWGVRGSDGELSGYGEPKRIHIEDARTDTLYSNFSGNYDVPDKLTIYSSYNLNITNNQLKFGSYIFYKRYTTKYDERTVLSFPSNCVDISEGFVNNLLHNTINISGFAVDDDIVSVEIIMSNDSSNTFKIVRTIDTSTNKTILPFEIDGGSSYPVLDGLASDIINNNFPFTATEQEVVDNRLVYGDVDYQYEYKDSLGATIDKNTPFSYATTGIDSSVGNVFPKTVDTAGSVTIAYAFTIGNAYRFTINSYKDTGGGYLPYVYEFDWTYSSGTTTADTGLAYKFILANSNFTITPAVITNFTVAGLDGGAGAGVYGTNYVTVDKIQTGDAKGLNSDFRRKAAVVFMDDKGRNAGVSHITDIYYTGSELTYSVKPNMSASGISVPYWATKYMFVRDKANTNLSYSIVGNSVASSVKTGYNYLRVETPYYTNYLADKRGEVVTVYSKYLLKDIEVTVLTTEDRTDEAAAVAEADEFIYIKNDLAVLDGSMILYRPNREIDSPTEIFYETSNVFTVSGGVFAGDLVDSLDWYDTRVGKFDKTFSTSTGDKQYIIMKTDKLTLADINHLGRGAYILSQKLDLSGNATIMHSQKYSPDSNHNGLSDFSYLYNNVVDLERKYGSVEKLFFDDTNLLVGQKKKWSKILINKEMLSTADGSGALQASTSFFNQVVPYAGDFGITDKRSFASYGFRRYFVDQNNGIIGRLSVDGITPINKSRTDEIITISKAHNPQNAIVGTFDVTKGEYVVIYHGSDDIIRFSEKTNDSCGSYELQTVPYQYIMVNTKLYSITQGADDLLWEENLGLGGGKFYGNYEPKTIAFVVNIEPNIVKDYLSISINGKIPLEVSSGDINMDVTIDTDNNTTSLVLADFLNREGILYADYMKDENADGASLLGVGTVASVPDTTTIVLKSIPNNLNAGSKIYKDSTLIGTVESFAGTTVNLTANMTFTPSADMFINTLRPSKIEGKSIKGNTALVTISIADDYNRFFDDDIRIFSVTTNFNVSSNTE